jgi:uncharacterized membrane protein required for colicin V production
MGWIWDILLIAILVLSISFAARKGFVRTVIELIGYIAALAAAAYLGGLLAEFVFETFIRGGMVSSIQEQIEAAGFTDMAMGIREAFDALPGYISATVAALGITPASVAAGLADGGVTSGAIAASVVDLAVKPAMLSVLRSVFHMVLFLVLLFVVRRIAKASGFVNKIPLVGDLNIVLGGAFGLLKGVVWVLFVCTVVKLVQPVLQESWPFLQEETIESSYLFRFAYLNNPVMALFI